MNENNQEDKPDDNTSHTPLSKWTVLVHNDDVNTFEHVIDCFTNILGMQPMEAAVKTLLVDQRGVCSVKVTHKEHAELVMEQLKSQGLRCTIEPYSPEIDAPTVRFC
jgi:ATP-dependent Clp protease adaptor protein ClpS